MVKLEGDEAEVFDVIGRMPQSFCRVSVAFCSTCRLLSDAGVPLPVIGVLLRESR